MSKRINNLHINSLGKSVNQQIDNNWNNGNNSVTTNNLELSLSSSSSSSTSSSCNGYQSQNYRPHLNANDNPYYYENNKLLYSLYADRMNRRGNDQ